ncbi:MULTISPECIES: hypothetical protein [Shewanella]|uniref:hypothetical protein n=1 Tax=Shewanella TaxID=22 RepID=UPI001120B36C|nr:hypothetical protein [Shewanella sp. SACH]
MTDKKLISKAKYMEILKQQLANYKSQVDAAKQNYATLDYAIDDLEELDFEQVEVVQDGENFSFNIVEKTND